MFNTDDSILINKQLKDLGEVLVPEKIRRDSPQLYELIIAFLNNIQNVQDSINNKFFDRINIDRVYDKDILNIYFKSYMASIKIDESEDVVLVRDIISVSKDLSEKKGTVFLFHLMTNFLFYLLPDIKTIYDEMLIELNDENISESRKVSILHRLDLYKLTHNEHEHIKITEGKPFEYDVELTFRTNLYNDYIKPFCHPAGWTVSSLAKIYDMFEEHYLKKEDVLITQIFINSALKNYHFDYVLNAPMGYITYDARQGTPISQNMETDVQHNILLDNDASKLDEWKSKTTNPESIFVLDGNVVLNENHHVQIVTDINNKTFLENEVEVDNANTTSNISNTNNNMYIVKYRDDTTVQSTYDWYLANTYKFNSDITNLKTNHGLITNSGHNIVTKRIRLLDINPC